jgi:DNA-binding transcriptional regulator YiaG
MNFLIGAYWLFSAPFSWKYVSRHDAFERESIMKELLIALCDKMQKHMSRKSRAQTKELKTQLNSCRHDITVQKRRVNELENSLKQLQNPNSARKPKKRKFRLNGEDIIRIRERLEISQSTFARLLDINRVCLNRWEHNRVKISQKSMQKIAPFREMGKKELQSRLQAIEAKIWND